MLSAPGRATKQHGLFFPLLPWIPGWPPVGSPPWKLTDNSGHFNFHVKMQFN